MGPNHRKYALFGLFAIAAFGFVTAERKSDIAKTAPVTITAQAAAVAAAGRCRASTFGDAACPQIFARQP